MERIMVEFNKIMLSKRPSKGLNLLDETGLLNYILPELTALKGIEEIDGMGHKDNFYHTLEVVDNISQHTDKLWLRWAALLHDIGKAPTKKFEKNNFQNIIYEVKNSQLVNKLGYTAYGGARTLYSQHYIIITQDSVVEILVSANSDLSISQY